MNRLYYLITLSSFILLSNCINTNKNLPNSALLIEKFNLNHYSNSGQKLYRLETPFSIFNKKEQSYSLDKTNIKFYEMDEVKYLIKSDTAKLLNNNKLFQLKGNVEISDIKNNKTTINSNILYWDINKSEITLEGNVILINNLINLNASKAVLDKKTNIIKFFEPVKYNYIGDNTYNISSENAYYNLENKNVLFKSENSKVKSRIVF